jgi:hypothetical protein
MHHQQRAFIPGALPSTERHCQGAALFQRAVERLDMAVID